MTNYEQDLVKQQTLLRLWLDQTMDEVRQVQGPAKAIESHRKTLKQLITETPSRTARAALWKELGASEEMHCRATGTGIPAYWKELKTRMKAYQTELRRIGRALVSERSRLQKQKQVKKPRVMLISQRSLFEPDDDQN
jgi:hypothetical protein